jgi:YbbR domain-containing protein
VAGGGATAATTKLSIDPAYISISGSETALAAMEELDLGIIELAQITKDQELTFDITLPEGITNVSNLPTATVSISFPKLSTREFTITEFDQTHLAPGMKWESLTKQLTITVRGLKAEVQRLNAADIIARVDLSGVENTSAVEPDIIFPKSYESLGVLGSYSISVQVTPEPTVTEE